MIRVYTDMAADMFHVGHLNLIKRAKEVGDYLIVGVHSDADISKYKRQPIIDESERYQIVESCRYVDEVITSAPLVISEEFITKHNIHLIVRGDDMTDEHKRQQAVPIKMGIMRYLPRTKGISTSKIISKIKDLKNEDN